MATAGGAFCSMSPSLRPPPPSKPSRKCPHLLAGQPGRGDRTTEQMGIKQVMVFGRRDHSADLRCGGGQMPISPPPPQPQCCPGCGATLPWEAEEPVAVQRSGVVQRSGQQSGAVAALPAAVPPEGCSARPAVGLGGGQIPALAPPGLSTSLSPTCSPLRSPTPTGHLGTSGNTPTSEVGPNCPPKEGESLERQQNVLPEAGGGVRPCGAETPRSPCRRAGTGGCTPGVGKGRH